MTYNIEFKDINGVVLSKTINNIFYKIEVSDVEYVYFTRGWSEQDTEEINIISSTSMIEGEIQVHLNGLRTENTSWVKVSNSDFVFNTSKSKEYNNIKPKNIFCITDCRIKIKVSKPTTIFLNGFNRQN